MDSVPQTPKNTSDSTPSPAPSTPTWKLSDKEKGERRKTADELSQHNEKDRDRLRHAMTRSAEVKELIRGTDLGKEQEELKDEIKFLESSIESRGETIEKCLREARTGETTDRQDALPGIPPAPKVPKEKKPSAAARTLALPEHAGEAQAGEAQLHEGGDIAPPAPAPAPPALPPGPTGGPATIDVEVIDPTAEHNRREKLRSMVLDVLAECPLGVDVLRKAINDGIGDGCWPGESTVAHRELEALLRSMVDSGALLYSDVTCAYRLPEPPAPKTKKKAPAKPASKPSKKPAPAAKGKKGRGSKAVVEAPLPVPAPPTTGHAQRVLRGWLYARLTQAGELTLPELRTEAAAYHPELVMGTLDLLLGCGLVLPMPRSQGYARWCALEDESGRGVDQAVQDETCGALADGPLDAGAIAAALGAPLDVVRDVLSELREAGRIVRHGDLWQQTQGMAEAAE